MNGCFGVVGLDLRKNHVNIYGCLRGEKMLIAGFLPGGREWRSVGREGERD